LNNFQKILLASILILIPISYLVLNKTTKESVIVIPPLEIETSSTPKNEINSPDDILSTLQVAVSSADEGEILSQEEEASEVLEMLQQNIQLPPMVEEPLPLATIKEVSHKVATITPLPAKKSSVQKSIYKKTSTKRHLNKRTPLKKHTIKRHIVKKETKVKRKHPKEKIVIKKVKETTPNIILPTYQEPMVTTTLLPQQPAHHLPREVEVALYQSQHANELEIVGESKAFEIKDPTQSIPDEHFFKRHNPAVNQPVELNQFVQTLGVVKVSRQYEVQSKISKKVELARDGVVDIPTATVETEELKKLKFVKPLAVTEVSQPFEASQAERYLH